MDDVSRRSFFSGQTLELSWSWLVFTFVLSLSSWLVFVAFSRFNIYMITMMIFYDSNHALYDDNDVFDDDNDAVSDDDDDFDDGF